MKNYDHKEVEGKWQAEWEKSGIYRAQDSSTKPKWYSLVEFPYPSGDGLHTGHIRSYTAMDIISRKRRMEGHNVLYPIGWDAFGLPTENYAIKTGIHPTIVTKQNTDTFRRQLKEAGFSFDWDREVNTTDPKYYKWTQWIFLQLFKKGLAYKTKTIISWCPSCKTGLANEEVVDGKCERCGAQVEKREKDQWMLAITKYAQRLYDDLDQVNYLDKIKISQRNWIGPSEGSDLTFKIKDSEFTVTVFTTRADTLFGVTYMVLAPENELVKKLIDKVENRDEVEKYIKEAATKVETERVAEDREKTGVPLKGIFAVNPATGEEVPVWIADYVLASYGTGAVMAVPAHDDRDYAFAKKYNLPIKEVIIPNRIDKRNPPVSGKQSVERHNVQAIVKNPKTGKYLCLHSKNHNWNTFPMGGVNDGEDIIAAAKREVAEESGYVSLSEGKLLGGQVRAEYFAKHKDVNRVSFTNLVYFELLDEKQIEISKEESDENDVLWIDEKDLYTDFMVHAEMDIWRERLNRGDYAFTDYGVLVNSGEFNGQTSEEAKKAITAKVGGEIITRFKLRDWVFSRQHYWGEPIPIILCDKCGFVPVDEKDLPVELPMVEKYKPSETGESPLADIHDWVNVKCPKCGGEAKRETDTMPNWAGSSWYFLRYIDPQNDKELASMEKLKYWMNIDWYNGGMEHTTLHLLYSRFWNKFLCDIGAVPVSEPYQKRTAQGMILGEGGIKMSKSKGNVVNPDTVIRNYGADTLRLYEMFMGPFDQAIPWSTESIIGSRRFLERVWRACDKVTDGIDDGLDVLVNQTISKITTDIEKMSFNTAISTMMILINEMEKKDKITKKNYESLLVILAPFAPHATEELWAELGHKESIHLESWPKADEAKLVASTAKVAVQVNGRVRVVLEVAAGAGEDDVKNMALNNADIQKWLDGKEVKKVIYVQDKLLSLVT